MFRSFLSFVFALLSIPLFAQPKAYLVKVEVSKLIETAGDTVFSRPIRNKAMDYTDIANLLDSFLRSEYFNGFPIEITEKKLLAESKEYPYFFSPIVQEQIKLGYKGDRLPDTTYSLCMSIADGYVPNETLVALLTAKGDLYDFADMFPEADIFIGATVTYRMMTYSVSDSPPSEYRIVPGIQLKFVLPKNKKFFIISRSHWHDIPYEDRSILFDMEYDVEKQKAIFTEMTEKLFSKMLDKKEKDIQKMTKWLDKKYYK